MFLPQNPSTSPPADPPSTAVSRDSNVMVTCGPKDRWTVLFVHLIYVIPSLGLVKFKGFSAFTREGNFK